MCRMQGRGAIKGVHTRLGQIRSVGVTQDRVVRVGADGHELSHVVGPFVPPRARGEQGRGVHTDVTR